MWGSLVALALLLTINPLRVGIILLVLSRPRPMQNLLAYWVGTLLSGLFYLVIPLAVLHATPTSAAFIELVRSDRDPVVQHSIIALGSVLLLVAAMMAVRSVTRSPTNRVGSHQTVPSGTATATLDSASIPLISRLTSPTSGDGVSEKTPLQRLFGRAREAWRGGSTWIAFALGLMVMPADGVLLALAVIVASGAAIGTQLGAAVGFVLVVLAFEEVILISNVFAPTHTQTALRYLHHWATTHHRKFMAAILVLVGASLIVQGVGGL